MVDVSLPPLPRPIQWPSGRLLTSVALITAMMLLFGILASINWSAVLSKADRECNTRPGPFSSGFSAGFQTL